MTDMSGSRLWPLALMGWLAAMPAVEKTQERNAPPPVVEAAGDGPGVRTAWLSAARARYAAMPAEQRDRLRRARRAGQDGGAA